MIINNIFRNSQLAELKKYREPIQKMDLLYGEELEQVQKDLNGEIENENIFNMNDDIFSEWVNLLQKADLIKFAKKSTPISEMEDDKNIAFNIIKKALN